MCGGALGGTIFDVGGVKKKEDKAKKEADRAKREYEAQKAESDKQLREQKELSDAQMAHEKKKENERAFRLSQSGGGLSTRTTGIGIDEEDKLGG